MLTFTLTKNFPAVVGYNKEVLGGTFLTDFAIARFMIEGNRYYDLYEALAEKEIENVVIAVDVKGVKVPYKTTMDVGMPLEFITQDVKINEGVTDKDFE